MPGYLRQSTAVDIPIGPFLDDADGKTAETSLTISQADVRLKKGAAAWAQKADTNAATHEENGNYECSLNATDTNTLGRLRLHVAESGALPVWDEFTVIPADMYDSLFVAAAGFGDIMVRTTMTVTNQTTVVLADGSADDDAYNDAVAVITDQSTALQKSVVPIADYVGSTKTVTFKETPKFTIATSDLITIISKQGAILADSTIHGGTAAKITLERVIVASATSNEPAVKLTGNGTAAGLLTTGGATGPGIDAVGGGTSGAGMRARAAAGNSIGFDAVGAGSGEGIKATGGATGEGIEAVGGATSGSGFKGTGTAGNAIGIEGAGQGSASGIQGTGGATGHGINGVGGATSGAGVRGVGTAGNSAGFQAVGQGSAAGFLSTGGATGHGISAVGGATSGDGISAAASTSGHGLTATGVGTTKHGINATGGSTTSHGASFTGGGVGHGILATSGGGATGDGIRATAASTNGNGLNGLGVGTGMGIQGTGGATGHGINGIGGATSGAGLRGVGTAGNSSGMALIGQGSAAGLQSTGGATGAGIQGTGGATSGAGLVAAAAAGNSDGATFTPAGTGLGMNYTNTVAGRIKKNTAFTNFMIKMELTDGSPGTGLTVAVQRIIDGGTFANLAVTTVTEISAGWYKFDLAAADVNGNAIGIKATATGAKQLDLLILTQVAG